MNNKNDDKRANKLTSALLRIYLVILLWVLVFKLGVRFSYMANRSVNLIPFRAPAMANGRIDFSEMILNAVIFVLVGIYAAMLFERWNFGKRVLLCFFLSLTIEALQFILKAGSFDITDIITNTVGGLIGLIIFEVIKKIFNRHLRAQKFLNVVAAIGTTVVIVLLVLLKLNMLPIRYQ